MSASTTGRTNCSDSSSRLADNSKSETWKNRFFYKTANKKKIAAEFDGIQLSDFCSFPL